MIWRWICCYFRRIYYLEGSIPAQISALAKLRVLCVLTSFLWSVCSSISTFDECWLELPPYTRQRQRHDSRVNLLLFQGFARDPAQRDCWHNTGSHLNPGEADEPVSPRFFFYWVLAKYLTHGGLFNECWSFKPLPHIFNGEFDVILGAWMAIRYKAPYQKSSPPWWSYPSCATSFFLVLVFSVGWFIFSILVFNECWSLRLLPIFSRGMLLW